MANLKEIAEAAGTSIRTVSRVVHGAGYVGAESRARIEKAIRDLGYVPDLDARALRTGRRREIVILAPGTDELMVAKIAACDQVLREAHYRVHLIFTAPGPEAAEGIRESLGHLKPAGVLLLAVGKSLTENLCRFAEETGLPLVAVDPPERYGVSVLVDRPRGVEEAVRHLWAGGRRRIAYVGPAERHSFSRLKGYRKALAELGGAEEIFTVDGEDPAKFRAWVKSRTDWKGLGIIAFTDVLALSLMQGLHDLGFRIPQDISVVGFDDRRAASLAWPPLTTVAQPNEAMGRSAASMLLAWIASPGKPPADSVHPTTLKVRESG